MPLQLHQFGGAGAAMQPGYLIAKELARQCVDQYHINILPGPGGGIATGSCWAAFAVQPNMGAGFPAPRGVNPAFPPGMNPAAWGPIPYSMVFGNSQMAAIGALVPVPGAIAFANHAERNALVIAGNNGLAPYAVPAPAAGNVLFVQLAPCGPCSAWLQGGGGGVANPFAFGVGGGILHVWYRWPYPAGIGAMVGWNGGTRANKLTDIDTNW